MLGVLLQERESGLTGSLVGVWPQGVPVGANEDERQLYD